MTTENKSFRNLMYVMMFALLVSYIGYKFWHVSLALDAFEGQEIDIQHGQPAK